MSKHPGLVLHIKVFKAGVGRLGYFAVIGPNAKVDHDDTQQLDREYDDTPRQAVDRCLAEFEKEAIASYWSEIEQESK